MHITNMCTFSFPVNLLRYADLKFWGKAKQILLGAFIYQNRGTAAIAVLMQNKNQCRLQMTTMFLFLCCGCGVAVVSGVGVGVGI